MSQSALCALAVASLAACSGGGGGGEIADLSGSGYASGGIERFGSIQVNGVVFDTSGAVFKVDDSNGQQADLFAGQRVEIVGQITGPNSGVADRVVFEAEIEGPVSLVSRSNSQFTALGQTVRINGTTIFENGSFANLVSGDYVEVSGEVDENGDLVAGAVEVIITPPATVELTGTVGQLDLDQRRFSINGQVVDFSIAVYDPNDFRPGNGDLVEVTGALDANGVILATEVEDESEEFLDTNTEVELDGIITSVSGNQFVLRGFTVQHGAGTQFENGNSANLQPGTQVEVEGVVDANGVIQADEVDIDGEDEQNLAIKLEGNVQNVNEADRQLTVFGLVVNTKDTTLIKDDLDDSSSSFGLGDLQVGDFVEIRAFIESGRIVAGRIERDEDEGRQILQAPLDSKDLNSHTLVIAGITVNTDITQRSVSFESGEDDVETDESTFYGQAVVGDLIKTKGAFNGNLINAFEVSIETEGDETDDDDDDDEDEQDDD
jgi:hypothetical protein